MISQDFTIYQGETVKINFAIVDEDGNPVNLTNHSVHWALGLNSLGSALINKYTPTASGVTITNANSGYMQVSIDPSDTTLIRGRYYHEARITDPTGVQSIVAVGYGTINSSITA